MSKKVLVIIPSYKPDIRLRLLLDMLVRQQQRTYELLGIHIINTAKNYWQEGLIPTDCDDLVTVTHIPIYEFDHGGTRRFGAENIVADFLLFMTQDAVPADDLLIEKLVEALDTHEDAAVTYARQLAITKEVLKNYRRGLDVPVKDILVDELERYTRQFNYPAISMVKTAKDIETMGVKAFFCSDVCAMYRREAYITVGGFVSPTIFGEDMIFAADAIKKGFSVVYQAEARVYHSHRYSSKRLLKRNFDIGVSQSEYADRYEGISSEKEGVRFVLATMKHLFKSGYFYLVPRLILHSIVKYVGYFLGRHYKGLPYRLILQCTSNKRYWINKKKGHKTYV